MARDMRVRGVDLKKGDRVVPFLSAANRDPRVFEDPDTFDVNRRHNPHLALGLGRHFCLGAKLARLEGRIAVDTLVRTLPRLRFASFEPNW